MDILWTNVISLLANSTVKHQHTLFYEIGYFTNTYCNPLASSLSAELPNVSVVLL